jgi:hypothetical protein
MTQFKTVPDADLSSAGDDFHILWAIKKSLDLLNFEEKGLKAVVIEDIEKNASRKLDPLGDKFLGIDLTEYYGSANFKNADKIVISQLKYSTRRANENYTYSKLYNGKKSSYSGSIIHRLATTFKVFINQYERKDVLEKTSIKLISNREINPKQINQINKIKDFLRKNKRPLSFNDVINTFPEIPKEPFIKLRKASGLNLKDFTDFIRLLDFKDCGSNSRQSLKFELLQSISKTSIKSTTQFNSLFQMVWNKMMPEKREERAVTILDVVANFGFSSIENLFPVSQNFEKNLNAVDREQLNDVVSAIKDNINYLPICIHGGAGIGKSTFVNQLKNNLPRYSECLLFDCYGAGKYQNPEDKRHLHKNAIVQLANELAKRLGTEFLLIQNESDDIYLKEFIKRINSGIELLKTRNPLATLTIIVDAADNSITAAKNNGETSFVENLLNIEIPEGCNIVVTTRTFRKESLTLPNKHIDIELKPFSLKETTSFVKNRFPNITTDEVTEFHKYTNGIPRVQFYSLDLKEQGINEIINYLKPNGKTVGDLVLDKIEHALTRIGKDKKPLIQQFFRLLISLPRPIPISYLSELMNIDTSFLKDLSSDIWNGLILENDLFSFRDEDFENYVRETYQSNLEEIQQITQLFLTKAEVDEYASINLGNLLYNSNYKKKLVDIVLKRELLALPKDPIRNREVYINRTKLALKASKDINDDLTYFKLLFIAAEESKTDKALTSLLLDYPDLVSRFGDEISLSRFKLKSNQKPWGGSFHLKLAGTYSRKVENKEIALRHLKTAHEWIDWRRSKKKEELKDYPISSLDIAYETEAVLKIYGIEKAINTLNRWSPKGVRLSAGNYLVENIISYSKEDEIKIWLSDGKFRIDVKVFIICKSFKYNKPIPFDLWQTAANLSSILSRKQIKFKPNFRQLIIRFCLVLAYHKIDQTIILDVLKFIKVKSVDRIPYFYNSYTDKKEQINMENWLLKETLLLSLNNAEANIESFYPDKFKNIDNIEDYRKRNSVASDKREFAAFYKYAIAIYKLHSDILTRKINEAEGLNNFQKICDEIKDDYHFRHTNRHWGNDRLIYLSGKLSEVALLFGDRVESINLIIDTFDDQTSKLRLRLEVLDNIILQPQIFKTVYKLFDESDKIIKDSDLSANESTENYIKCLIISSKVNDSFAKYFFNEAVKATSEIDYEAFSRILCISYLSRIGITESNPKLAYEYARFIEYCDIKLGYYDNKHFPYLDGLLGIGYMDIDSMFSTICRWHHRNIVTIGRWINSLIKIALEKGYIDHIIAGSLFPLKTNHNFEELEQIYESLIEKYDESCSPELKGRFIQSQLRDLRLVKDKHFTKKIYDKIESGKFIDSKVIDEVKNYVGFLDILDKKKDKVERTSDFKKEDYPHNIDITTIDYTSTKELEKAINFILTNNKESFNNRWNIENFLSDILNECTLNKSIHFLDALVDISDELLDFYTFENIIGKAIQEWDYYPDLKKWKQERFKYILLTKLQHFDHGNTLSIWSLKKFSKLFSIDENQLADVMIEILPQKIDLLSDESIYSSFELIKNKLSRSDNQELLEWILKRWNTRIKPEFADGVWSEELIPPSNSNENIAYLLRFLLGHPDKKLRWRAIHSIRRLANLDNVEILKILLSKQNQKDCTPFQSKGFIYYWMSAKLYLWIAIERISLENPNILIQFKDDFYSELISNELPHVLIRHYIKKSCLNLHIFNNSLFTESQLRNIQVVNCTKLDYVEEKSLSREQRKYSSNSDKNWRFKFDSMDTLPYWYSGLGRCFNLSEYDVADVADMFITEKWGYTGKANEDDFIRKQLDDRDWHLTRNDHGRNPEIESLNIYFEYHSMYCAASFLLEREPLLKSDSWDSWEYWLNTEANGFNDFWLSDLRDPIPLELEYWKNNVENFDEYWRDNIPDEYFDDRIGLQTDKGKWIIVFGGITKHVGVNEESVSIMSCLVSMKGSDALLRALQTAKDSYDYSIPFEEIDEDEYGYDKKTIDHNGFSLKGWLTNVTSEYEGLDSHDPLFNGTSKGYVKFGKSAQNQFNIEYDSLYKKGYVQNELISEYKNWNEISDEDYRHRKYSKDIISSGSIFQINSDFLLRFLTDNKMCMIIKCTIERQLEERIYRERYNNDRNKVKLFLIKPDGTIKTLRGRNYKIG